MKCHWFLGLLLLALPACQGEVERDCAASCAAFNDNQSGHDWVSGYAEKSGYQEYSRCLNEAVARSKTAAELNCTHRGNEACAKSCRSAGSGR